MVRFWIIAALCAARSASSSSTCGSTSTGERRSCRGRALVVGVAARSGVAVAGALRRGAAWTVRAARRRRPALARRASPRGRRAARSASGDPADAACSGRRRAREVARRARLGARRRRPPAPPACRSGARSSSATGCCRPARGSSASPARTARRPSTELVGAMLGAAGAARVVAGNVGVALSGIAGDVPADGIVVCELSSFQLEDVATLRCDAAALLNLTPDHLDRHGTMEEYGARQAAHLRAPAARRHGACSNDDDPWVAALADAAGRRPASCARTAPTADGARASPRSRLRGDAQPRERRRRRRAGAARWARRTTTIGARRRRRSGRSPHRLEHVGDIGGVSLLERLEGHERRRHAEGADGVSRRARCASSSAAPTRAPTSAPLAAALDGAGARART